MKQTVHTFLSATVIILILIGCAEEPEVRDEIFGAKVPEVVIDSTGSLKATQITVYGRVVQENGVPVTEIGFQWRPETTLPQDYTQGDSMKASDGGKGSFSQVLKPLKSATAYYVRAYARNKVGTQYSEELYFATIQGLGSVETLEAEEVRAGSFVTCGRIVHKGEGEIIRRGFYYSTASLTSAVAPKDSLVSDRETDTFTCTLEDLHPATTYYVQAFVTNHIGTSLGNEKIVTTLDGRSIVSHPQVMTIGYTEATLQGSIIESGEATVTERGFCYSTDHPDPIIEIDDTLRCGDGQGIFKSTLKGLLPDTEYYVRVYAINKYGVAYGATVSIRTLSELPEVVTSPIEIERPGVIRAGGEVINQGHGNIPVAGICWSVNPLPTIDDHKQQIAQGMGSFSTLLYTMRGGVTYYVRAYVQNNVATTYGEQQIIETPSVFSTVSSYGGSLRTVRSASYVTLGSKGYVFGGDDGLSMLNELYSYDPSGGWMQRRAYRAQRSWMMAAAVTGGETKDVIVAYGGIDRDNIISDEFNYYDPTFNSWHEIEYEREACPGATYGGVGCAHGDEIYFIGGVQRNSTGEILMNEVWTVNLSDRNPNGKCVWTKKNSFPEGFYGGFAAIINDTVYAGLGLRTSGATPVGNRKLHFSADKGETWETLPDMPGESLYLAGAVHDKDIYVTDTNGYIWLFNTGQRTWIRKSRLPEVWQESVHCMFSLNGYIYFGFGRDWNSTLRYFSEWDVIE
ncbi:MAG: hypothetical protein LBT73_01060 [Tannerellaceae bacterium]|jgi:N-acetylneuraminic acid mutarotase|nr:hypothetical protein [Tannerellaceae bacterium]